jgi:hypothetical protein
MQINSCVDPIIAIFTLVSITCQQGMEMLDNSFFNNFGTKHHKGNVVRTWHDTCVLLWFLASLTASIPSSLNNLCIKALFKRWNSLVESASPLQNDPSEVDTYHHQWWNYDQFQYILGKINHMSCIWNIGIKNSLSNLWTNHVFKFKAN